MRWRIVTGLAAAVFLSTFSIAFADRPAVSTRTALGMRLSEAKLIDVALVDALAYLHDAGGVNIVVDWKALESINIGKDTLVNLNLHGVPTAKILSLILQEAGGDKLTWYIDKDVVQVTTQAAADQQMITVIYDVTDLIGMSQPFTLTAQAGGGTSVSTPTSGLDVGAQKLIKLIEQLIRPEIWKDNGQGGSATIEYFDRRLIIFAPRSVQESLGG
jgi:hypothetical protein